MSPNPSSEKVKLTSMQITDEKISTLRKLFPEAFIEGNLQWDNLREALGDIVDNRNEVYSFSWAGKANAKKILQKPSQATLKPCVEESVNFENTENIFIEGDNLEVIKLLLKSYYEKVKMIYIDPPFNTGNDFIYPDDFTDPLSTYLKMTNQIDNEGQSLTTNQETSGRYHSSWLSMMYPRLYLAREILTEDGSIWISIDDHEFHNLRMLMNEIFGEENFISIFIWEKRTTRENRRVFSINHDYIICYAKNKELFEKIRNLLPATDEYLSRFSNSDNDPRGKWQSVSMNAQEGHATPSQFYEIITPSGRKLSPPPGRCWVVTKKRYEELLLDNRIYFGKNENGVPRLKVFLSELEAGLVPHTLWKAEEVGTTDSAKKLIIDLFKGKVIFDTPKPIELLKRMISISTSNNEIIMDFFSGSCSMAHAVYEMNTERMENRKYICIQLPEPTENKDYPTVSYIGKERIKKVINILNKKKNYKNMDLGFKMFKLSDSNFTFRNELNIEIDKSKNIDDYIKSLDKWIFDPIKENVNYLDICYEIIIKEGLNINSKINHIKIGKNNIYKIEDDKNKIYLCIDKVISKLLLDELKNLKYKNTNWIFSDNSLDDALKQTLNNYINLKVI